MASSSSSHQQNAELDLSIGIGPQTKRRRLCGSSKLYDVFINHRGPDVKQTLARDLYNFLQEQGLSAFLDSEELELGDVFPSNIDTAIRSSSVHIAIFSKGYADSAWCLEELALMIETRKKIIPVFYNVAPSDLRYIRNDYAHAFAKYEKKSRYLDKLERWKKSLEFVSVMIGYEFTEHNNDRIDLCKKIVKAVLKEVRNTKPLHVAEHPVGLNERVQLFESYCKRNGVNVNIIGIFGMGGVGKTTLAKAFFNQKRSQYDGACFLSDVREAHAKTELPSLQSKLLQDLVQETNVKFHSIDDGISHLKHRLGSAGFFRFLIVLDDIDNMEQLDALLIRDKLNLVIVTTRDEGLLKSAGITLRYNLRGMDIPDGKELFCWHAFSQPHPACGYEDLVDAFVKECGGLPLSLKVFGRHVRGRSDQGYWLSELQKIRRVLPEDVIRRLKVSFDSLDVEEKQIFMDIACFFIGKFKSIAIKIWEISGWTAEHALQRLKDKCLVEEINHFNDLEDKAFRMHDHLRDLGREMADKQSPRRLWRPRALQSLELKGFQETLAETNGRCFHSMPDRSIDAQITFFLGNPDDSAQTSTSLLLLELEMNDSEHSCIPSWIPLKKLRYLKIFYGRLKRLWQNNVQVPPQLKELVISQTLLEEFPDLSGIVNQLERVVINGNETEIQGWCLLKSLNPRSFVLNSESTITIRGELTCSVIRQVQSSTMYMSPHFPNLLLFDYLELKGILSLNNGGQSNIDAGKLVDLNINACHEFEELCLEGLHCLQRIEVHGCKKLICLEFIGCKKLKTVSAIKNLQNLEMLNIHDCPELQELKPLERLVSLEKITIDGCGKINRLELRYCENLKTVSGNFDVTELVIDECRELEELPSLAQMSRLERIEIMGLVKLKCLEFIGCKRLKTVSARVHFPSLEMLNMKTISARENLQSFEVLNIRDCPELEEVKPLERLVSLEKITIDGCGKINHLELRYCEKLKTVSGNFDVTELVIDECRELEELPSLGQMSRLERIEIMGCVKLKCLEFIGCKRLKTVSARVHFPSLEMLNMKTVSARENLQSFEMLNIRDCPELEEVKPLERLVSLEKITIDGCGKINHLELRYCEKLKTVSGNFDVTELVIDECTELAELPSVGQMSRLERIEIMGCVKLKCLEFIGCKRLKTVSARENLQSFEMLNIRDCPELEEVKPLKRLVSLEKITIDGCGKINHLELRYCEKLKTVSGNFDVTELVIDECRELEELPSLGQMNRLERIEIMGCVKLKCLEFIGCKRLKTVSARENLQSFEMLNIRDCPELEEVKPLERLVSLEKITIDGCGKINHLELRYCEKLKTVSGNFDVTELVIDECRELEELPSLGQMNRLERIEIMGCVKLKCLEFIGCKRLKTVSARDHFPKMLNMKTVSTRENLHSFEMLNIGDCPELEEVKPLERLVSLEKITIDGCGKINRLELRYCEILKTVSGNFDVTELVIYECRQLKEIPNLAQMSRLERIEMDGCEKLQDIASIEELQGLKTMKLSLDSNSNQWLQRLSKVPSEYMRVIGRAGDGAHSTLNSPDLFSSIMGNHAAVHKIHIGEDGTREVVVSVDDIVGESDCLSAIIVCAHVVVPKGFTDYLDLSNVFEDSDGFYCVEEGEWIVSMVMSDENQIKHFIQDKPITISMPWYSPPGKIKNACVVRVKKGQEWEAVQVVKAICNQLYKK